MNRMEVESKVKEIVGRELGINEGNLNSQDRLVDNLGADSLDMVEIIMYVEEQFAIEISDAEADAITTIEDLIENVFNKVVSQAA